MEDQNDNNANYSKILEDELSDQTETINPYPNEPEKAPISTAEKPKKKSKAPLIILLIIILLIGILTAIFFIPFSTQNPDKPGDQIEEEPSSYEYELKDLNLSIDLPLEFNGKIYSESDGENIYIWGYTGDEAPEYVNKNSENFFPFFALNYSKEAFSTEKYSFSTGNGAHTRDDDEKVLYLHSIIVSDEALITEDLTNDYYAIRDYFIDGFKYQDF